MIYHDDIQNQHLIMHLEFLSKDGDGNDLKITAIGKSLMK